MCQVNMLEAKTGLSKLVKALETVKENIVYIARNGHPVVQMTLIPKTDVGKRIGIAKGKFTVPDDFDEWDDEVSDMFEESL